MTMRMSSEAYEYERQVYDFLTFLSDLGGLFGTIFIIGKIVVDVYLEDMFFSNILESVYQVDSKKQQKSKKIKNQQIANFSEKLIK